MKPWSIRSGSHPISSNGCESLPGQRTLTTHEPRNLKLYAIDPHEGYEFGGSLDTYPILKENIKYNDISEYVEIIKDKSTNVKWSMPIVLLFIDGLHDYESVKNDFTHFRDLIIPGGLIAFHDYFQLCPDAEKFVNELLLAHEIHFVAHRDRLIVIRK